VERARAVKSSTLQEMFRSFKIDYPAQEIFLRVFKAERQLELWARGKNLTFTLVKTYPICALSGTLGPKRQSGDLQVPEGFYRIESLNPASRFHLSLKVNYPNESDRILGTKGRLGGDIFIHGDCVTIGCIPIEDGPIEEVYLAALDARSAGQKAIAVHIFPRRMSLAGMSQLDKDAGNNGSLKEFWKSLEPGYRLFEVSRRIPKILVDSKGKYIVEPR